MPIEETHLPIEATHLPIEATYLSIEAIHSSHEALMASKPHSKLADSVTLTTVLRLRSISRIALVGGGSQTTTPFALARDPAPPVIVAATAQMALTDRHFFISVARLLWPTYPALVIAALKDRDIFAVHEPVAGIILAAGAARRMGQPKPLLMWRGEPFIRQVARTALAAGLSPVVIVGGAHTAALQAAVAGWPVTVVYNADWEAGQSTSVRRGLRALPPETGAAIFLLADQPHSPVALVRGLIERHAQARAPIVAPLIDGRRGNPVLFDRSTFDDLRALRGEVGGRAVLARHAVTYLPWPDASLLLDVDTPEDYQRLLRVDRG